MKLKLVSKSMCKRVVLSANPVLFKQGYPYHTQLQIDRVHEKLFKACQLGCIDTLLYQCIMIVTVMIVLS